MLYEEFLCNVFCCNFFIDLFFLSHFLDHFRSRVATPPQISPNLLKFEISPQVSSNLLKKCRFSRKSPQIQKTENYILAISLLNNSNNFSVRAVKHNCVLDHHESISLYCLIVCQSI